MSRVLVVDDKEDNRYYLQALLGGHGFEVSCACHGAEALVRARQAPPDVVISDLLMPVMDGYTLLRHWKMDARLRSVPFIVYTATYTEAEDERLALELGADAFILKPAEPEAFLARLREVQDQAIARAPAGGPDAGTDGADGEAADTLLEMYSRTLIRKLEEKTLELENANQALAGDLQVRRRIEAALRESEERLSLLARATHDAIWDWDLQTGTRWWNEGFETLFGYRRADIEPGNESWTTRIHPDDVEGVLADVHRVIDGDASNWAASYRFRRADRSYADVEDHGLVVRDAAGTGVRMVGGMSDATERKALEMQLRQAQRLESIGQLTGGIAHDFNNLLTVILGNAELLVDEATATGQDSELAEMILTAAQRGADLTNRLLAFARKQMLMPKAIDLNERVRGIDALLRRTLGEQIEIDFVPGDGLWRAQVDPSQLENALLNLSLNARDAMPDGGCLIIETANASFEDDIREWHGSLEPGDYVMLAVSDTGCGIPPAQMNHVFEPFFTTKAEGEGTGLGLAMVYGFVKQSRGHVSIYSEAEQGTTVKLFLPRATAADVSEATTVHAVRATGGGETILLVEDDELVRRYARDALRRLGYRVIEVEDGIQALEVLDSVPAVDLLLTDMVMPRMSGRDLADQALQRKPALRVLFTSGYTQNAVARQGMADLGAPLLNKPYQLAELASSVRHALA